MRTWRARSLRQGDCAGSLASESGHGQISRVYLSPVQRNFGVNRARGLKKKNRAWSSPEVASPNLWLHFFIGPSVFFFFSKFHKIKIQVLMLTKSWDWSHETGAKTHFFFVCFFPLGSCSIYNSTRLWSKLSKASYITRRSLFASIDFYTCNWHFEVLRCGGRKIQVLCSFLVVKYKGANIQSQSEKSRITAFNCTWFGRWVGCEYSMKPEGIEWHF